MTYFLQLFILDIKILCWNDYL